MGSHLAPVVASQMVQICGWYICSVVTWKG
jgi:hypothetical protein